MVEAGEEPLAAAIREVREESLIEDLDFAWGESSTQTGPYSRGKVARYYLAECPHGEVVLPVSPELGVPEHQEFRWVRAEEAETLLNDRLRKVLAWASQRIHTSASAYDAG
jgi:bis(5'-nucleosidyl)-tetraphosphatase